MALGPLGENLGQAGKRFGQALGHQAGKGIVRIGSQVPRRSFASQSPKKLTTVFDQIFNQDLPKEQARKKERLERNLGLRPVDDNREDLPQVEKPKKEGVPEKEGEKEPAQLSEEQRINQFKDEALEFLKNKKNQASAPPSSPTVKQMTEDPIKVFFDQEAANPEFSSIKHFVEQVGRDFLEEMSKNQANLEKEVEEVLGGMDEGEAGSRAEGGGGEQAGGAGRKERSQRTQEKAGEDDGRAGDGSEGSAGFKAGAGAKAGSSKTKGGHSDEAGGAGDAGGADDAGGAGQAEAGDEWDTIEPVGVGEEAPEPEAQPEELSPDPTRIQRVKRVLTAVGVGAATFSVLEAGKEKIQALLLTEQSERPSEQGMTQLDVVIATHTHRQDILMKAYEGNLKKFNDFIIVNVKRRAELANEKVEAEIDLRSNTDKIANQKKEKQIVENENIRLNKEYEELEAAHPDDSTHPALREILYKIQDNNAKLKQLDGVISILDGRQAHINKHIESLGKRLDLVNKNINIAKDQIAELEANIKNIKVKDDQIKRLKEFNETLKNWERDLSSASTLLTASSLGKATVKTGEEYSPEKMKQIEVLIQKIPGFEKFLQIPAFQKFLKFVKGDKLEELALGVTLCLAIIENYKISLMIDQAAFDKLDNEALDKLMTEPLGRHEIQDLSMGTVAVVSLGVMAEETAAKALKSGPALLQELMQNLLSDKGTEKLTSLFDSCVKHRDTVVKKENVKKKVEQTVQNEVQAHHHSINKEIDKINSAQQEIEKLSKEPKKY